MNYLTVFGTIEFGKSKIGDKISPTYIGGNGITASLAAAKIVPVYLMGIIGNNLDKKILRNTLGENISIENVEQYDGNTFCYTAIYDEKSFDVKDHEIDFGVYKNYRPKVKITRIHNTKNIFLSGSIPAYSLLVLQQITSLKNIGVSTMMYHLKNNLDSSLELIQAAKYLFTNEKEYEYLQEKVPNLFNFALNLRYIFITDGGKGVTVLSKNQENYYPFDKIITPLDPTNAGDVFAATIMALLVNEENVNLEKIVMQAHEEAMKVIMNDPYYRKIYEKN